MAAIPGAELLQNVNACQANWMTHLIGDVHSGQSDHAHAYLTDCRQSFDQHQRAQHAKQSAATAQAAAQHAAAGGVSGFMHLDGMGSWLDPSQQQTVALGDAQVRHQQAMFSAKSSLMAAEAEAAAVAQNAQAIVGAAQGTHPKAAGNAFFRSKHKIKGCRKKLARCRARVKALEAGQSPEQADAAAVAAAPPTNPSDLGGLAGCACGRGGLSGLGYQSTPGSGIPQQVQQFEQRQPWESQLPRQSIAEGFRYALPSTKSAFLERSTKVGGGHGGVYSGEVQAGIPKGIHPALAAHFAKLQAVQAAQQGAFQQPWTNPWTYQQFFDNTAQGLPIWGGGYTQAFQPTQIPPGGTRWGAQPPVAGAGVGGGYPQPGSSTERF